MPLFVKLDFGVDGNIHAWVNRDDVSWGSTLSEASASTAKKCLHKLATKIGTLENMEREEEA